MSQEPAGRSTSISRSTEDIHSYLNLLNLVPIEEGVVTTDLPRLITSRLHPIKHDVPGNRCAGCVPNSFIVQYLGRPAHDGFQGHLSEMPTFRTCGSSTVIVDAFMIRRHT